MNDLSVFTFEDNNTKQTLRTMTINGEPWFVGKDAAEILGYKNPQEAIRNHVDEDDKGVSEILTPGGKQTVQIINESGLYSLIMSSKLPSAKKFKRWVTAEVLPSIRKHGAYLTPETAMKMVSDPSFLIQLVQALIEERKLREETEGKLKLATRTPEEIALEIFDRFNPDPDEPTAYTTRQIAHEYGRKAEWLNYLLQDKKIQVKIDGVWTLRGPFATKHMRKPAIIHYETCPTGIPSSFWTETGRAFIHALLEKDGFYPIDDIGENPVAENPVTAKPDVVRRQSKAHGCQPKPVRCVETGEVFESINAATKAYNKKGTVLSRALSGKDGVRTFAGYHWEFVKED